MVVLQSVQIRRIFLPSNKARSPFYINTSFCIPGMHHNNATYSPETVPAMCKSYGDGLPNCGQYNRSPISGDTLVSDFDRYTIQVIWDGRIILIDEDGSHTSFSAQAMLDRGAEVI